MTKVVFKFTIKRRLNCNYYYVNNILLILSWFNCLKKSLHSIGKQIFALMLFSEKNWPLVRCDEGNFSRSVLSSWHELKYSANGAEVVPSSCWHRGSIFSLSASTDIITDITLSPVSPRQASVRSSTGIFSVYRRAPWDGLLGKSIVSRTSPPTQRAT